MGLFGKMKSSDESVQQIDWTPQWATGAPCPHVISSSDKTFLLYYIQDNSATHETADPVALVTFTGTTYRFGIAGDEVQHGLPLWKKGLRYYSAHIIHHSAWIDEIKSIHNVHARYDEKRWEDYKHFVLLFQDETFEIIAKDFKTEVFTIPFREVAIAVIDRIL